MLPPDEADDFDFSPWTPSELNLLATETADLLAGDGLDQPDNASEMLREYREERRPTE